MNRTKFITVSVLSLAVGKLSTLPVYAASMTQVSRATWGANGVPSYVEMYIYVPDKLAVKPPILVSAHSCGSTASGQLGNIPNIKAASDKNGFILILPDNPGQNCWDVGSSKSLKHDGGGDTQAIAQMVKYALTKYSGDATRVYAMGGSSGAMMTQALMAVYPDVFKAGSARAGVPAGCWADGYDSGQQWSNTCAAGNVMKTAQAWGDAVRAMYSGYTGHRPRVQIIQGTADSTISFKNSAESIKEWTNVLELASTPTSTDTTKTSIATYERQFWKNSCDYVVLEAWAGKDGSHSMGYEEDAILKFFGLDKAGGADPEDTACGGNTGVGGSGGIGGSGGVSSTTRITSSAGGKASTTGSGGATGGAGGGKPNNSSTLGKGGAQLSSTLSSAAGVGASNSGGSTVTTQLLQGGTNNVVSTSPMTFPSANGGAQTETLSFSTSLVGGAAATPSSGGAADSGDSGGCTLIGRNRRVDGTVMTVLGIWVAVLIRRRRY